MSPADIDVVTGAAPGPATNLTGTAVAQPAAAASASKPAEPAKPAGEAKPAPAAQKPAPAATPVSAPAAASAKPAPAAPKVSAAEIERWFIESFHGSPVAQNTESFNHVRRAVDDLKRRLSAG